MFYLAGFFLITAAATVTVVAVIMSKYKLRDSWILWLIFELARMFFGTAGMLAFMIHLTGNIVIALAIAPIIGFFPALRDSVKGAPLHSTFYRLSVEEIDGVVVLEKHVQPTYDKGRWRREWLVFNTTDNQRIEVREVSRCTIRKRSERLDSFEVGDSGTLHYRKRGKRYYFEAFKSDSDDIKNESSEGEQEASE